MNEQTLLTISELEKFFETNGNLYKNPNGIELELTDSFSAWVRIISDSTQELALDEKSLSG